MKLCFTWQITREKEDYWLGCALVSLEDVPESGKPVLIDHIYFYIRETQTTKAWKENWPGKDFLSRDRLSNLTNPSNYVWFSQIWSDSELGWGNWSDLTRWHNFWLPNSCFGTLIFSFLWFGEINCHLINHIYYIKLCWTNPY